MKKTPKYGIPYIEYNDICYRLPEYMKINAEAIEELFEKVFKRINLLEGIVCDVGDSTDDDS